MKREESSTLRFKVIEGGASTAGRCRAGLRPAPGAAHGPRIPPYNGSARTFRTLFVLIDSPNFPATADQAQTLRVYREEFVRRMAIITGGRARIVTGPPVAVTTPVARFTSERAGTGGGLKVHFFDDSSGEPSTWRWTFGDGTESTLPSPTHKYAANGDYTVTLTVTNSRGTNSNTQIVRVAPIRRRSARH